jgi:hypothetical protein
MGLTVAEAIEKLKAMPPGAKLLRADNSGGYEGIFEIKTMSVEEINFSHDIHHRGFVKEKLDAVVME